jgi:hypothetical protein
MSRRVASSAAVQPFGQPDADLLGFWLRFHGHLCVAGLTGVAQDVRSLTVVLCGIRVESGDSVAEWGMDFSRANVCLGGPGRSEIRGKGFVHPSHPCQIGGPDQGPILCQRRPKFVGVKSKEQPLAGYGHRSSDGPDFIPQDPVFAVIGFLEIELALQADEQIAGHPETELEPQGHAGADAFFLPDHVAELGLADVHGLRRLDLADSVMGEGVPDEGGGGV